MIESKRLVAVPYNYGKYQCWLLVQSVAALSYPARSVTDLYFYQDYPNPLNQHVKSDYQILGQLDAISKAGEKLKFDWKKLISEYHS